MRLHWQEKQREREREGEGKRERGRGATCNFFNGFPHHAPFANVVPENCEQTQRNTEAKKGAKFSYVLKKATQQGAGGGSRQGE